jgi:hypothetical protein
MHIGLEMLLIDIALYTAQTQIERISVFFEEGS